MCLEFRHKVLSGSVRIHSQQYNLTHLDCWITVMATQVRAYMYRVFLCQTNVVVDVRVGRYFGNFKMGAMNDCVA
jgi:hypothetical protein